jgi:hypothetical protein
MAQPALARLPDIASMCGTAFGRSADDHDIDVRGI